MTPLLLLLIACPQQRIAPIPESADWIEVPAFVTPDLPMEHGSWMNEHPSEASREKLRFETERLPSGALQAMATDFNGFFGSRIYFRLTCSEEGVIDVWARSSWTTDLGSNTRGPYGDLHGEVLVEARTAGDQAPLRIRFRLHGIKVGSASAAWPRLTEGELELPLELSSWSPNIAAPELEERREFSKAELEEVSFAWPDGKPRSHGWLDPTGRRQGVWTTWTDQGTKQSESRFEHGEREGRWAGYHEIGSLCELGHFKHGLREGTWSLYWGTLDKLTITTGRYVAGVMSGEWVTRWANGTLCSRGTYEGGRRTGPWTFWWRNGNKRCEGTMVMGSPDGEWTHWNEDGSVDPDETKKRLVPWR